MVESGMFLANHGFGAGFCGGRVFEKNVGMATDGQALRQSQVLLEILEMGFSPASTGTEAVYTVLSDSCDPMDCSLPASSVHGILQARTLEWVAISSSR